MWRERNKSKALTDDEFVSQIRKSQDASSFKRIVGSVLLVLGVAMLEFIAMRVPQPFLQRLAVGAAGGLYAIWVTNRREHRLLLRYYDFSHELARQIGTSEESTVSAGITNEENKLC